MTKLKIEGMTCNHCVMAVKQALEAVPGVKKGRVDVTLQPGAATVEGDASTDALVAAVADEGYSATVVG
jgi:copper chaperone